MNSFITIFIVFLFLFQGKMSEIVIYFQYDGEWKQKNDGSYEWCRRNKEIKSIVLLDDPDKVKYSEVIDCIFKRLHVD